ncbi:MAG: MerR family transcriptional regulator [Bacteroidota bacterium]
MSDEIKKLYYSISEVSSMFDVSNSLLRFWESEFDFLKPKKNRKGDRKYTQKDIDNIKLIYHLVKEKGFTLEGAKREIKENKDNLKQKTQTIERLKEIRAFLEEMKKDL